MYANAIIRPVKSTLIGQDSQNEQKQGKKFAFSVAGSDSSAKLPSLAMCNEHIYVDSAIQFSMLIQAFPYKQIRHIVIQKKAPEPKMHAEGGIISFILIMFEGTSLRHTKNMKFSHPFKEGTIVVVAMSVTSVRREKSFLIFCSFGRTISPASTSPQLTGKEKDTNTKWDLHE